MLLRVGSADINRKFLPNPKTQVFKIWQNGWAIGGAHAFYEWWQCGYKI